MKKVLLLVLCLTTYSTNTFAYCSAPSAPYFKPNKPSVPFCVNEYAGTHTCDDYTISSYISDIDSYNYDVQRYVQELQNYVNDAQSYANCEIRNLD